MSCVTIDNKEFITSYVFIYVFGGLFHITENSFFHCFRIDLSNANLSGNCSSSFMFMDYLVNLTLANNRLHDDVVFVATIDDETFSAAAKRIDLSGNSFTNVVSLPPNATEINFSNNNINSFPLNLPSTLQKLNLSQNRLGSLPTTLPSSLQSIDISQNRFNFYPLPKIPTSVEEW